jgi:hypothetical protein
MIAHRSVTSCATLPIPSLGARKDVSPPLLDFFAVLMSPSLCTLQDVSALRSPNDLALRVTGHECASLAGVVSPSSINNAALPPTAFAATSQTEPTTTDSRKINAQPTDTTATSNISGDGDGSISDHYRAYDPGGDRLSNTIEGTPACNEADSTHAMKATTCARRSQHARDEADSTCSYSDSSRSILCFGNCRNTIVT